MPTVLLLDVSLSMNRVVPPIPPSTEMFTRRSLAIAGINSFLDHMCLKNKLEFVALVIFSSLHELMVSFTRDYGEIRTSLTKLEEYNKSYVESALIAVNSIILEEWGASTPCQVVLITDGRAGLGEGSLLQRRMETFQQSARSPRFLFRLHVLCVTNSSDPTLAVSRPLYQQLVDESQPGGQIYVPDGPVGESSIKQMFATLCERFYTSFSGTLRCGNLKCPIYVFPTPENYVKEHEFQHINKTVSKEFDVCGFISIRDIASPPYISRHLILPLSANTVKSESTPADANNTSKQETENGGTSTDEKDGERAAALTVLLHGALKIEQMVAVVEIGEEWYGMIYSYADSKKKSNLMLSIFEPGSDCLPWMGDMSRLTAAVEFPSAPYPSENPEASPFPVSPADRRSYTQNCVVWIKNAGLQADIQKILRSAKRLPEKQQHFYKELNRLRSAALSLGFYELLSALALLLERECQMLPSGIHPDAALQMNHVVAMLRRADFANDASQLILPLQTNFTGGGD